MSAVPAYLPQNVSNQHVYRSRFISLMFENDSASGGSEDSNTFKTFGDRYDWSFQILSLSSLTPALENALLATSTARLGRHANRPALVCESLKLYTQSVAQVRRDILRDTAAPANEQSLAACLSLLLYEAIECPGKTMDGYLAHYRGCLKLLQMREAGAYTTGLAHTTLQILRLHTVILGNEPSGISFLAQPDWLDLPWSSQPDTKSLFEQLVDILLQLPNLASQMATLAATRDPQHVLQTTWDAIEEVQKTEDALEDWFGRFRAALPGDGGSLYRAELSQLDSVVDSAAQGKLFPVAFHFPAFMVGQALVYYWVTLMSVRARLCWKYEVLRDLAATLDRLGRARLPCACETHYRRSGDNAEPETREAGTAPCLRHFDPARLPRLARRAAWPQDIARNVCQSAEYFLRDTNRGFGPASVLPALEWVRGFWQHAPGEWGREMAWIDDMVGRIHASGYGIAGAMLEQRAREGARAGL
ncbi:C6 zinc finger domain-containing protein [Apiospora kogelbergensis]|uniref:C6 zinc finger domain-containing protein n=1 Tax=Apiospora kogelbergensis TaxID=1337665 RepID=UPI0031315443